jgi:hypothetical protein
VDCVGLDWILPSSLCISYYIYHVAFAYLVRLIYLFGVYR